MITLTQMEYFMEVVRCRSITAAAEHLFITQPALGRQMTAMEKELNMQLLMRTYKGIIPTPAGELLCERFSRILDLYRDSLEAAHNVSMGYAGKLALGILDGLDVDSLLADILCFFEERYPNVEITVSQMSFGALLSGLQVGDLDAVISLDVNFFNQKGLELRNLKPYRPAFAIPAGHPLAQRESLTYSDLKDMPVVIVNDEDCAAGVDFVKSQFKEQAGYIPSFQYVNTLRDALLWVESGRKCAVLNMEMKLAGNPSVKMYPIPYARESFIQLATTQENLNFSVYFLKQYIKDHFAEDPSDVLALES